MTDSLPSGPAAPRPPFDLRLDRSTPARYDHFLDGKDDHFITDSEDPTGIVKAFRGVVTSGAT
jgi:hypothetical protein